VARDRKRAKQRRDRRTRESARTVAPNQPQRADVPGALDHASADADEFDAALVRGAEGVPAEPGNGLEAGAEEPSNGLESGAEDLLQETPAAAQAAFGDGGARGDGGAGVITARPSGAPIRSGNRAVGFLRASWAELQRVQWPDRRQVTQATAVVLGFVAIAGLYLGLADVVAKEIVEFIL
jgi:preprotein translocase SecE subunit